MEEKLTDRNFARLSAFIEEECGIKMPHSKKVMLEARLRKRLRALDMHGFSEYCDLLLNSEGDHEEKFHMIDAVTTNKTDFFREPGHFDYLTNNALPELVEKHGAGVKRRLHIWSAGCSTGEEPYSIAMAMAEYSSSVRPLDYRIHATDISMRVLNHAKNAVYQASNIEVIPDIMKHKYLLRCKDRSEDIYRIAPSIRESVEFKRLNFKDDGYDLHNLMDIVFCRNVIIYFDRETQEMLLNKLCNHLMDGGFLFMGHTETLSGMRLPLSSIGQMIYRKLL